MHPNQGRVVPRLRAWVDRSLPPAVLAQDPTTRRRARLCVLLPLLGSVAGMLAAITQLALGRPMLGVAVNAAGIVASALMSQTVRVTGSVRLSGHVITLITFGFLSASAVIAGGLGAPRTFGLILAPMLATLLVGWRGGLVWMGIVALEVVALVVMTFVGPELAPVGDAVTLQRGHAAGVLILMAFAMGMLAFYDRTQAAVAEDLEEALARASAANRLKSALVANVSHELRTPLNGVLGSTDLLLRSGLADAQRGHAETIETAAESLLKLVDDLLDTSRLEAGGMELESIPLELRRVLGETMDALAPIAEARGGGRLVLSIDADVPEHVIGDPFRLRQIVTNLVSNAIKFTEEGHVVLRVTTTDGGVRFVVEDTGAGIAAEDQARLFEAFEQAAASTARRFGGTGLGLGIARRLVELMGGTLTVDSAVGEGTTFAFTLDFEHAPMAATSFAAVEEPETHRVAVRLGDPHEETAAREALRWSGHQVVDEGEDVLVHDGGARTGEWSVRVVDPSELGRRTRGEVKIARPFSPATLAKAIWRAAHQAPSSRPPSSSLSGRGRVLLADDTPVNRRVAEGQLAHLGYEPTIVEDGAKALAALKADPRFIGVFLDVRMPAMDGYETAEAIRAWERETGRARIPLFALTAHEEGGERKRARAAGFDRFLVKPLRIEDFEHVLEHARTRAPTLRSLDVLSAPAWAELELLGGGQPGFLSNLVRSFQRTSRERIAQLEAGEGDAAEIAHALKGAARQLGAYALADACERLEQAPDERALRVPDIARELARASDALLAKLPEGGGDA